MHPSLQNLQNSQASGRAFAGLSAGGGLCGGGGFARLNRAGVTCRGAARSAGGRRARRTASPAAAAGGGESLSAGGPGGGGRHSSRRDPGLSAAGLAEVGAITAAAGTAGRRRGYGRGRRRRWSGAGPPVRRPRPGPIRVSKLEPSYYYDTIIRSGSDSLPSYPSHDFSYYFSYYDT
jgi:hypothetical protein